MLVPLITIASGDSCLMISITSSELTDATFKVSTVDNSPTKAVAIVVTPNPPTANGNGPYGFEETFTDWPNTLI